MSLLTRTMCLVLLTVGSLAPQSAQSPEVKVPPPDATCEKYALIELGTGEVSVLCVIPRDIQDPEDPPEGGIGDPELPKYREWLVYLCPNEKADPGGCLDNTECDKSTGSMFVQLWRQDLEPPSDPYSVGAPFCTGPDTPQPDPGEGAPTITIEDVMKYDIRPSPINIEPSPNTLIRFETNFYTSDATQNFQLTVGGQKFDVNVYPIEYTWTYGDGESNTIGSNGAPLRPGEEADKKTPYTHAYQETGTYQVGLTTKFIADYSMNGGPRQAILGTGEVATPAQTIDVWRTEIRNVDDACAENPDSWGCPGAKTP